MTTYRQKQVPYTETKEMFTGDTRQQSKLSELDTPAVELTNQVEPTGLVRITIVTMKLFFSFNVGQNTN